VATRGVHLEHDVLDIAYTERATHMEQTFMIHKVIYA
jgi:hypothetical protein